MARLKIHFYVQGVYEQGTYFRYHNLAIALKELGHSIHVFGGDDNTRSLYREEVRDDIGYTITPSSRGTSFFLPASHPLNAIRRALPINPVCDVAHLFQPFPSAALAWAKSRAKRKFFDWDDLWVGGLLLDSPRTLKELWLKISTGFLERILPSRAEHVTTCSHFLADVAIRRGAAKASVIHNGIHPFRPAEKLTARNKLGLDKGAFYVGFMGRTASELDWCTDAFVENHDKYARLRLALCGMPEEFLEKLPSAARKRVDYLGQLAPLDTRDFAAALDIGLLPLANTAFNQSRFPIKYAEYMAAGTPVLSSNIGECSRLSESFSWVLSAGEGKIEWARAFEAAVQMGVRGLLPGVNHTTVNKVFAWSHHAKALERLYTAKIPFV